ncbi:MAG: hypothetical protein Q9188_003356 [Gyalolechia gomerana]
MSEDCEGLPIANVIRIMRRALPPSALISNGARETVQECVVEFISFITSEAAENCSSDERKTVTGKDVLVAMEKLGFENYAEALRPYYNGYFDSRKSQRREKQVDGQAPNALSDSTQEAGNIQQPPDPQQSKGANISALVA